MQKHFAKLFGLLSILVISLSLVSCGPVYNTTYTYRPPASMAGRQCVNDCLAQKSHCSIRCQRDYEQCNFAAQDEGRRQYRAYHKAHKKDNSIGPDYFVDNSQCRQDCSCDSDYNLCYANCGGAVIPHTVCTAFCKKK
jgi:hypothetical protein